MEQPRWKKWLSWLFEWHIESAPSPINPHLYVSLKRGRYQLSTAHAVYSYGDLYDNFRRAFKGVDLDRLSGKKVLLLGFGLGSVPYMLETVFERHFRYTAVEIDESVIDLASRYVLPQMESTIELIQADAFAYMLQQSDTYDLIAMDVFLDDTVPESFESDAFLEALNRALKPDGLLIYNRLAQTQTDKESTRNFYKDRFKKHFPKGDYLDVKGNWMLINRSDYRL
ncbi:MAG: methyltransferase domain-containing protein [Bacteroidetes bacterium]|nr:methyltransferase domain-containing protein [Bacteroidota bacterium]